jgi:prepilin-type processing-associated H-X9-DG protein
MEGGTLYNAINVNLPAYGAMTTNMDSGGTMAADPGAMYTAWVTVPSSWLCPSDGKNSDRGPGLRAQECSLTDPGGGSATGNCPTGSAPINPGTGLPAGVCPVSNYAGSFGDNYCGGTLMGGLPWETFPGTNLPPGAVRIGWPGYWGTNTNNDYPNTGNQGGGQLRGYFDYSTDQVASIDSSTDGTSNTIIVGEVLPYRANDSNFYGFNGATAGCTVPLGWNSNTVPPLAPNCPFNWQAPNTPLGCRFSASAKGFVSEHPGGANLLFADGSVHFLKNTISLITYAALGSRNGGEVISSGAY